MGPLVRVPFALLLAAPLAVAQSTLVVPTAYPTIQVAIAAATPGDTVLVLPGTYVERIDFLGKAITVRGANGAAVTTIDGNQGGPVVRFVSGEGLNSVLEGFTVRNGRGGFTGPFGLGAQSEAGGIHCDGASPTIRACVIRANTGGFGVPQSLFSSAGRGGPGGVLAMASAVRLHDCVITDNSGGRGGDGVGTGSPFTSAIANDGGPGGLLLIGAPGTAPPEIVGCRIGGNFAGDGGAASNTLGPAWGGSGAAGGLEVRPFSAVYVVNCSVRGNRGGNGGSAGSATGDGGHGAFRFTGGSPNAQYHVLNCAIVGNRGGDTGLLSVAGHGGGSVDNAQSVLFAGSTVAGNVHGTPVATTGGVEVKPTVPLGSLDNCILWGNSAPDLRVGSFAVDRCNVGVAVGSLVGNGNLSVDPLFVNSAAGDVHLTAASPCRHAGAPLLMPPFDLDGDPRVVGPAPDMGADEWDGLVGTREDFALELRVNGAFAPAVVTSPASAGATVAVRMWSPSGGLANAFAVVGFEPWLPPAAPVGPLPSLHLGGGAIVLGTFANVGPAGVTFGTTMPGGLVGLVLRVQAFALTAAVANGSFAATAARDVLLQ